MSGFDQITAMGSVDSAASLKIERSRELLDIALERREKEITAHAVIDADAMRRKQLASNNLNSVYSLKRSQVFARYSQDAPTLSSSAPK